jgi:hypothetical protein
MIECFFFNQESESHANKTISNDMSCKKIKVNPLIGIHFVIVNIFKVMRKYFDVLLIHIISRNSQNTVFD